MFQVRLQRRTAGRRILLPIRALSRYEVYFSVQVLLLQCLLNLLPDLRLFRLESGELGLDPGPDVRVKCRLTDGIGLRGSQIIREMIHEVIAELEGAEKPFSEEIRASRVRERLMSNRNALPGSKGWSSPAHLNGSLISENVTSIRAGFGLSCAHL